MYAIYDTSDGTIHGIGETLEDAVEDRNAQRDPGGTFLFDTEEGECDYYEEDPPTLIEDLGTGWGRWDYVEITYELYQKIMRDGGDVKWIMRADGVADIDRGQG